MQWLSACGLAVLGVVVAARLIPATRMGFYNDDFVYLDAVVGRSWMSMLAAPLRLGGYIRPFSRDLYFGVAHSLFDAAAPVYHWINLVLVLVSMTLVWRVARHVCGGRGALLAATLFALSHAQATLVGWVSGVQDLWAIVWGLAATERLLRGNVGLSALCFALGLASKESIALLPLAWLFLDPPVGSSTPQWRRCIPHIAVLIGWGVWYFFSRGSESSLGWNVGAVLALPWRFALVVLGVEGPQLWPAGLTKPVGLIPALGAVAVGVVLWLLPNQRVRARALLPWGGWVVVTGIPIIAVAAQWSAYYFVLPLAGLCVAIGIASERWPRAALAALPLLLLVSGQASINVGFDSRRDIEDPSISQVTLGRLFRGDHFARSIREQLLEALPTPPDSSLFLVSGVPANNGFFSGNGAGIRLLYRNQSLSALFYGQVNDVTRFDRPLFLLAWNDDANQLSCAEVTPASFGHLVRVFELRRHPAAAAAAAAYQSANLDPTPESAWNAGYFYLESGDTVRAARAWRVAAERQRQRAASATPSEGSATPGPREKFIRLRQVLYGAPRNADVLLECARAAAAFDTVLSANLYYRACVVSPGSLDLLREASPVLRRFGNSPAAEFVDSLIARRVETAQKLSSSPAKQVPATTH